MSEVKWKPIGTWLASCAGVCTLFEKGVFYGSPRDALAYARKKQAKFGELKGFIIAEVIWGDTRIHFEFYREDDRSRNRKAKAKAMKHLKRRGIRRVQYQKYLEKNPLERYLGGKAPLRPLVCSECGIRITRRRPGYKLKPVPLCQECYKK